MAGSRALRFLANLDSAFLEEPEAFVAFNLAGPGDFAWVVDGDELRCSNAGLVTFTASLAAHTLRSLVDALLAAGFSVSRPADEELLGLSACVLIDATGNLSAPSVYAYSATLWAIGEAIGVELDAAGVSLQQALACASLDTAEGEWLDLWGDYFGIARLPLEQDEAYARRIAVEVVRPRANGVALEMALGEVFGQDVTVTDVREWGALFPLYDGSITHNGTETHDADPRPLYGRFDVEVGFDLLGSEDPADYLLLVRALVNRMRAAGTYLRTLILSKSQLVDAVGAPTDRMSTIATTVTMSDTCPAPTDAALSFAGVVTLTDPVPAATDSLELTITYASFLHDGSVKYDGAMTYRAGAVVVETL